MELKAFLIKESHIELKLDIQSVKEIFSCV